MNISAYAPMNVIDSRRDLIRIGTDIELYRIGLLTTT